MNVPSGDAISRIRGFYSALSPSEKRVGDYILENYEGVVRMTLAEIARHSGVSDATAIRFCRSIGYKGWMQFRFALIRALPPTPRLILDDIEENDAPGAIARKVIQGSIQALEDTMAVLDDKAFERALDILTGAKRILIVGVGTSGPMANEMFNRLFRLGLNCQAQTDSYIQVMQSALLTEQDALIVISQTGDSGDPERTVAEAKAHGCPVVCITGNALSAVGQSSDAALISVSHETRQETIASRIAQYSLIHALYVGLAMRSVDNTIEKEHLIWDALMRRPSFQVKSSK